MTSPIGFTGRGALASRPALAYGMPYAAHTAPQTHTDTQRDTP